MTPTNPPTFGPVERANAGALIAMALAEDLGEGGDVTARATIPESAVGAVRFVARNSGVVAGLPVVGLLAVSCGLGGQFTGRGSPMATWWGPARCWRRPRGRCGRCWRWSAPR